MKYICFGYLDTKRWATLSESEQNAAIDECFAYDDVLRKNGHFAGGEALQSARNATTLRLKSGKVAITGFGVFEKSERPARTARNPATGAEIHVAAQSVPKFRPGADFKALVNGGKAAPEAKPAAKTTRKK